MSLTFGQSTEYDSVDHMWLDALRRLHRYGFQQQSRDGGTAELLFYSATLRGGGEETFLVNAARKLDPRYAGAELLWYLSGQSDIGMIRHYAPQYSRFAEHGHAWGAYGRRWTGSESFRHEANVAEVSTQDWTRSQLRAASEAMRVSPETRQAVVSMWRDGDLVHAVKGDKADLPCTLSLQFILRQGELHLVATMRSNDVWLGMPYDVYAFTCVQRIMAASLGAAVGLYRHNVGSLHLYGRDHDRSVPCLEVPVVRGRHDWRPLPTGEAAWEACHSAVEWEHLARGGALEVQPDRMDRFLAHGDCLSDAVACCLGRREYVKSVALRHCYDRRYPGC